MPIVPTFRRLRQEDQEFKTSLGYVHEKFQANLGYLVRSCLKTTI